MLDDSDFQIARGEQATRRTLDRHTVRLSRTLQFANAGIPYRAAKSWLARRTDANPDALRPQLEASLFALEAGLLDYYLIWALAGPTTAVRADRGSR